MASTIASTIVSHMCCTIFLVTVTLGHPRECSSGYKPTMTLFSQNQFWVRYTNLSRKDLSETYHEREYMGRLASDINIKRSLYLPGVVPVRCLTKVTVGGGGHHSSLFFLAGQSLSNERLRTLLYSLEL